jgi:COP9 signalosome complex subunit 1
MDTINIENYISNYRGFTKLKRLIFLIRNHPQFVSIATHILHDELKRGSNTNMYMSLFQDKTFENFTYDESWIETIERKSAVKGDKIDTELTMAKNSLVKDAIRIGHNDMGDFCYERGDLENALKNYNKTRELLTTSYQNDDLVNNLIIISLDSEKFYNIQNASSRIGFETSSIVIQKCRIAEGIASLSQSNYRNAALKFLEIKSDIFDHNINNIATIEDIMHYTILCVLATLQRNEIQSMMLDNNVKYKEVLELYPNIKSILTNYMDCKYNDVKIQLNNIKSYLSIDIYISNHINKLYDMIHEKMLLLYMSPYNKINLHTLSKEFNIQNKKELFHILSNLILSNKLHAKINAVEMSLTKVEPNYHNDFVELAQNMINKNIIESQRMMLRLSLVSHNFGLHDGNNSQITEAEFSSISSIPSGSAMLHDVGKY